MSIQFKAVEMPNGDPYDPRWILVDPVSGKMLDDAQGYGYKSKQNAIKAGWYKFGGGKKKVDAAEVFWKRNRKFAEKVQELFELNFKAIFYDKLDVGPDVDKLAKELGVVGFQQEFLSYLP